MSTIFLILHIIGFFTLSILALAVVIRNSKSATNILFAVFILEFLIYLVFNYFSLVPGQSLDEVLLWIRLVMAITSLTGPTMFFLAYTFPQSVLTIPLRWIVILSSLGLLSAVASLSPYLFTDIAGYTNNIVPIPSPGPLIAVYFLSVPILWLASFILLIIKYMRSVGFEKSQLVYFLSGIVINLSLLLVLGIVAVNIFKTSLFIPFMPLSFVALAGFIAYAILRHRFLDIQPIIARTIAYTFLIIFIAVIYVSILFIGSSLITKTPIATEVLFFGIVLTTIIAFTFQPIQKAISKFTDRIFFSSLYDSEKLLSDLSHIVAETIDFDNLTQKILNTITKEMRITKAAFLTIVDHRIKEVRSIGYSEKELLKSPLEEQIHNELKSEMHSFMFQELEDEKTKEIFRKYEVEVLIPIKVEKNEVAILILGPKSSGNMYSAQDLRLLDVFSSEAGIAIQNSRLYTDLKLVSEAKSQFVSVVSHQLRTPISVIRWSLEMMREKEITPKDKETFLDDSYQGAIFLGEQLDDILIALDIYDQKLFIKKEPSSLHDIFKDLAPEFATIVKKKKLNIQYDIAPEANIVQADSRKLTKMIKILLKNAIIYSATGGTVKVTAKPDKKENKNRAIISISDSGIGIVESERDHIFEEFFRSDRARTMLPNGLGLGMFIAQAFAKAHGGEIWFYSEGRDRGADFHIALPME